MKRATAWVCLGKFGMGTPCWRFHRTKATAQRSRPCIAMFGDGERVVMRESDVFDNPKALGRVRRAVAREGVRRR